MVCCYSVSLREMMKRASSAARAVSGIDVRESEEMSIPTLQWPPDPPPSYDTLQQGRKPSIITHSGHLTKSYM